MKPIARIGSNVRLTVPEQPRVRFVKQDTDEMWGFVSGIVVSAGLVLLWVIFFG